MWWIRLLSFVFLLSPVALHAAPDKDEAEEPIVIEEVYPTLIPRSLCRTGVAKEKPHQKGIRELILRTNMALKFTSFQAPSITPQQLWMMAVLADYSKTGINPDQLTDELLNRKLGTSFNWTPKTDNVERSLETMLYSKRFIFFPGDTKDERRYWAKGEGVWEVLNALHFYRKIAPIAFRNIIGRDRVSLRFLEDKYFAEGVVIDPTKLMGPAQVVMAAHSSTRAGFKADVIMEAWNEDLGTPTGQSSAYATLAEMEARKYIGTSRNPAPSTRLPWRSPLRSFDPENDEQVLIRDQRYKTMKLTYLGEEVLMATLYFYLKTDELLREHDASVVGNYLRRMGQRVRIAWMRTSQRGLAL